MFFFLFVVDSESFWVLHCASFSCFSNGVHCFVSFGSQKFCRGFWFAHFPLALAGVDCVSQRSLETIFGLCGRWGSGVESTLWLGLQKGSVSPGFFLVPE